MWDATMDEAEWLACTDLRAMLEFLRGKVSGRKLRLFACDCVERLWFDWDVGTIPDVVWLSERYAEGEVTNKDKCKSHCWIKMRTTHTSKGIDHHSYNQTKDKSNPKMGDLPP